jgi:RNase P subunit RPR2
LEAYPTLRRVLVDIGGWMMPQTILCKECGHVLYRGVELRPPVEIIQRNGGVCPKCGRKLQFRIEDIEILPVEEK